MNRRLPWIGVLLLVSGCESTHTPPEPPCAASLGSPELVSYELVSLPDSRLWYRGTALQSFDDYPQDEEGVVLFEYDGAYHYNPVQMAQRGMWFGDNYRRTDDPRYLERSEAHARRLITEADRVEGAMYFPYRFNFRLHNMRDQVMVAPWYSGMAQGQALSLFLRLHEWTGDESYRAAADSVMASLARFHPDDEPSVARVDCAGYYWIQEYPMEPPTQVLNGFIFAVWGVYEYWRATGDEQAETLVKASLATLETYLPEYREPGQSSYYCLKHRSQILIYHSFHIQQLGYLHRLSGNPYFEQMAELFAEDYQYEGG